MRSARWWHVPPTAPTIRRRCRCQHRLRSHITSAGDGRAVSIACDRGPARTRGSKGNHQLEASRAGFDTDGRQYTITVRARDNAGNAGSASTTVIVLHDQGERVDGASYSATTCALVAPLIAVTGTEASNVANRPPRRTASA